MTPGRERADEWDDLPVEVEETEPEAVEVEQAQAPASDLGEETPAGVGGSFTKRAGKRYRRG